MSITKSSLPRNNAIIYSGVVFLGMLSVILGVVVLIGWYTHNETLIQVLPVFVPMQFNTALGFLFGGLGFLVLTKGWLDDAVSSVGIVCGLFLMFMGLLTLAQYILGVDFGIDELMLQHYIMVETSHPGRMAPNTALCFSLIGLVLIMFSTTIRTYRFFMVAGFLGSLVFGLSVVALTGYLISFEAVYGWGKFTRMAVHTASGFILLSVATIMFAWHRDRDNCYASNLPYWFPMPVGISVLAITVSFWQAFITQQDILLV